MSLYSRALSHGVSRLINLPRLSIPVVTTLGLTLAAVLTVVALTSHLILRPLPDIHNESQLVNIKYNVAFSSGTNFPIINSHMAASLAKYRKGLGEVASTAIANKDFKHNGQKYAVVSFKASDNFPQVVGGGSY